MSGRPLARASEACLAGAFGSVRSSRARSDSGSFWSMNSDRRVLQWSMGSGRHVAAQLLLERLPGAGEAGFDGAFGDLEGAGDLAVGLALDLAQDDDGAAVVVELEKR